MADEKKVTDAEVAEKKAKKADNKKAKKAPSKFSPKQPPKPPTSSRQPSFFVRLICFFISSTDL